MVAILNKFENYFIPLGLNIVERTRAKVLLAILLVIFVFSFLLYPVTLVIPSEFPFLPLIFGAFLLLVLLKVTGSINIVGNLVVCLIFIALASTSLKSGGIYSHDLAGMFLVLICSVSLLDVKYSYFYCIVIFGFTIYLYISAGSKGQLDVFNHQRLQYSKEYYLIICVLFSLIPIIFLRVLSRLNTELIGNFKSANSKLDESNSKLDQEKTKIQKAKIELEKSNLKLERYAHTASHDLQQPIRTIISFTQLLSKKLQSLDIEEENIFDYLSQIEAGTKRMDAQVQDLLSFSKVSSEEETHIYSLNEIINDVRTDIAAIITSSEANIEVGILPQVNVIKSNISQVFQNLIINAIKYKSPDILVKIKIESTEKEDHWLICVSDNGIGIPKSDLSKIFRLYNQSNKESEGLGIGLAICQQIIESYGGHIWVESVVGKGSDFFFTLPKILSRA